ncbi:MAG: histidine kinase [Saprospiraceae bacterium]|nr:histidine kinase [Saprospiraceae bacterium]
MPIQFKHRILRPIQEHQAATFMVKSCIYLFRRYAPIQQPMKSYLTGIVFILILADHPIRSQSKAFRYFTDEDGLPGMTVYGILQDPKGFLWIATSKGICRFDGRSFKRYQLKGIKGFDTPYSFIDKEGIPWFYNLAGEILFVRNDSLQRLEIQAIKPAANIYSLYIENPYLYISWSQTSSPATYRYNIFNLKENKKLEHNYIFLGPKNGELIGYDYSRRKDLFNVYKVDKNELIFSQKISNKKQVDFIYEIDRYIHNSSNLDIYIASNFIRIVDSCGNLISNKYFPDLTNENIKYISIINEDELFINTNKNSYSFFLKTGLLKLIPYFNNSINTIFEDSYNRRWISTTDHGLILDPNNSSQVINYNQGFLASNEVYNINHLLGYNFLGHNNGKISCIKEIDYIKYLNLPGLGRVRFILGWKSKTLLIGLDLGIYILNSSLNSETNCSGMQIGSLKAAHIKSDSELLVCSSLGIYSCDLNELKNGNCKEFVSRRELDARALCIKKYKGRIFAGTVNGLYVRGNNFSWQKLLNKDIFINQLYNYKDSLLWICTDGEGMFQFDGSKIVDSLNIDFGLPSNNISSVCYLDSERIAIGTDNGAYIYNYISKEGFILDQIDGLPGNEINDIKYNNGVVWIGTSKGLFQISSNELIPNQEKPLIEISEAFAFSRYGLIPIQSRLNHDQNHLKFNFQTRSLISKSALQIYYKLFEQDTQWLKSQSNSLEFIGLAAGKYNLQLKVLNEDQLSSEIVTKTFEIYPPWWKTTWFNVAMILGISTLGVGYSFFRHQKIKREEAKERAISDQMNMLREEALQNQMNPHFMFNALNAIQSFLTNNDQFNAMKYLSKFGRLIRMIFEQSKQRRISLEQEIAFLKNYLELEKLRFKDKVSIEFNIANDVEEKSSEKMIPSLIIQPIIENAFKHGLLHKDTDGRISISMEFVNGQFICIVEDNGIGRQRAALINTWKKNGRKSTGLASTKERLGILDKGKKMMGLELTDLYDLNGNPAGTRVVIKL